MNIAREVQMLFEENRRTTGEYQYTLPSKEHYPYQWLWDSCFHAIILARSDPESARAELCSLLSKQIKNRMVAHILFFAPLILPLSASPRGKPAAPRDHHLIGIINPDESGEDNSPRFDAPLLAAHDISYKDHLALRAKLVDENTACNFDAELCMRNYFWVKDVLFNTVLVENLRALGHIASFLKHADGENFANLHAEL